MAPKLVLAVMLMEFLISKALSFYMQPYSSSPYAIRDPRSPNPYQSYYASYASNPVQPTYQRPTEVLPSASRTKEYIQPSYPKTAEFSIPELLRPFEFRPNYPAQIAIPNVQTPIEYRLPSYQKPAEFVSPTVQSQRPVEYRMSPYQKSAEYAPAIQTVSPVNYQQVPEYVTPKIQPMELPATCQKASELLTPIIQSAMELQSPIYQKTTEHVSPIQTALDYHQPAYQKVVEFIANQKPVEIQQSTSDLTKFQPSHIIPTLPSSALESLKALASSKSDCLTPKPNSGALDADVLNNLAIALQLLIVNNIINNHPRSESIDCMSNLSDSIIELAYPTELSVTNPFNVQTPCEMPNAKFLGSSGDDNMMSKAMLGLGSLGTGLPLARPGFTLMSPYDAIAASSSSSSPFSDSSQSLFALKNNFQSPYAAMMSADKNKDLFSISELF